MSVTLGGPDPTLHFNDGTSQATAGVPNNGPCFSAYSSEGVKGLVAGVHAKVDFQVEDYDYGNCFSDSRHTPDVAGIYNYSINVRLSGSGGTDGFIGVVELRKNGIAFIAMQVTPANNSFLNIAFPQDIPMNGTGDYIEVFALTTVAGGINNSTLPNTSRFSGHLVRAT